jgi:diaminopimelate decarboxylase
MDHFGYRDGELRCEDVSVRAIADAAGTPCYVYSRATLTDHFDRLATAFAPLRPVICYSIKSCPNLSICRLLAECGAGMDVVSGGELRRALLAGASPARCVYAGVGKTDDEIRAALDARIGWLNIESEAEFRNVSAIARAAGTPCRAALRVNPDVDPHTHRYTTTGKRETKFGVDIARARRFLVEHAGDEWCLLRGIHLHIGSPVYRVDPYVEAVRRAIELMDDVSKDGHPGIEMLDLGGGFGADYETNQSPDAADYAQALVPLLEARVRSGLTIVLEPGRTITANAGILLLRVLYVKSSGTKTFVVCDGGMNALMRPCLYGAFHFAWPCSVRPEHEPAARKAEMDMPGLAPVTVVGPICESADFIAQDRPLPPVGRGDVIAVFAAGAYGMSMANRYNSMPLPAEVLVDGDRAEVIRARETYDDLVAHEMRAQPLALGARGAGMLPSHSMKSSAGRSR